MRIQFFRVCVSVSCFVVISSATFGQFQAGSDPRTGLSYTVAGSKRVELFVCAVTPTPKKFTWKNKEYELNEVWVEKRTRPKEKSGITLQNWEVTDGYRLCFNLKTEGKAQGMLLDFDASFPAFNSQGIIWWHEVEKIDKAGWIVLTHRLNQGPDDLKFQFVPEKGDAKEKKK